MKEILNYFGEQIPGQSNRVPAQSTTDTLKSLFPAGSTVYVWNIVLARQFPGKQLCLEC